MPDDTKRNTRRDAIRDRDAGRLEASLGALPAPVERPGLTVLVGLPGSGKSHFARALAGRYPAAILDSDALRRVLFEKPQHSPQEHGRLFPAIHLLMERLLARGVPVIVDSTNVKESSRRPYYQVAENAGVPLVLVRVWAPRRVILERLSGRIASRDPMDRSTATLDVYKRMRADVEPISRRHVSVDTSREIGPALDKIAALLQS